MKSQTLPIKRRKLPQGMFRRLSAVTQGRRKKKQRVAASGTADMDLDEGSSRISWALTIVFLIHVVVVCLILIHHHFLEGRPDEQLGATDDQPVAAAKQPAVQSSPVVDSPLTPGETVYIVESGDNYASIAKSKHVLESDLREINGNTALRKGLILKIPAKPVANPAPQLVKTKLVTKAPTRAHTESGLVPAIDARDAPKAVVVKTGDAPGGTQTYVVQSGDTVYGIAKRYGIPASRLMQVNHITDPRKLYVGIKLRIP